MISLPRHRLWFLGAVNGLILLHILFCYILDRRSLGCIDFFGLATFLGNGQITAGTIFLAGVVLLTLILGRVFCGWGCHFALFQDLLVRFFARVGLRTTFRRSRLEYVVPPIHHEHRQGMDREPGDESWADRRFVAGFEVGRLLRPF